MSKQPAVYNVANKRNGTLNTGVTSNLVKRIYEHKSALIDGFTKDYGCNLLVYYELYDTMDVAILKEKQIKGGSRKKKLALIEKDNPNWNDLYETIL